MIHKYILIILITFFLWPPANTMEHKLLAPNTYTFRQAHNYIKISVEKCKRIYRLSAYQTEKLLREIEFELFIRRYMLDHETDERLFDLDLIDDAIFMQMCKVIKDTIEHKET